MKSIALNVLVLTLMMSIGNVHNFNYCTTSIGQDNTLCKYEEGQIGSACGEGASLIPMTDGDKTKILEKHNTLRRKVAQGNEDQGPDGAQPAAANMMKLAWDDELEIAAQRWASQCVFDHDKVVTSKFEGEVGQNSGEAEGVTTASWDQEIDEWYSEVSKFPSSALQSFPDNSDAFGHYSQIVWAKTNSIGCAAMLVDTNGGGKVLMFCNYVEGGNTSGATVYIEGDAGTQCPEGTESDSGLCA